MADPKRQSPGFCLLALLVVLAGACGDGSGIDPIDVRFGDTALVVVVNPAINDGTRVPVAAPGSVRAGLLVSSDDGPTDTTGPDGIAVLAPLSPGIRTVEVSGGGVTGSFSITMGTGMLREVALAADGERIEIMATLEYLSDRFVELSPAMSSAQLNDALRVNDRVVILTAGTYAGDLAIAGTRVTLIGEGLVEDTVTIQGSVTMSGADSRLRGARITGGLMMPATGTSLSFSRVDGTTSTGGSDMTLLNNALCGGTSIAGSVALLGNRGVAPTPECP